MEEFILDVIRYDVMIEEWSSRGYKNGSNGYIRRISAHLTYDFTFRET